jgi:hypothetical protein
VFLASDHLTEMSSPAPSLPLQVDDDGFAVPPEPSPQAPRAAVEDTRPGADLDTAERPSAAPEADSRRFVWDTAQSTPARRHRPIWLAFWVTSAGLAALALSLQAAHAWRHEIASNLPTTRAALQTLCQWLDCRVEPVRRLSDLSVESSELKQWGGTIYRIGLVLRNRADVPLMLPMLDVTLTDVRGAVIARKALALSDFGVTEATIGARQELSLQGHLNAGDPNVAGYTIELFHP